MYRIYTEFDDGERMYFCYNTQDPLVIATSIHPICAYRFADKDGAILAAKAYDHLIPGFFMVEAIQ